MKATLVSSIQPGSQQFCLVTATLDDGRIVTGGGDTFAEAKKNCLRCASQMCFPTGLKIPAPEEVEIRE